MFKLEDIVRRRPEVAAQETPDGAVLIHVVSGQCWELNRVGAMFWSSIGSGAALRDVCLAIRQKCDGVADDVVEQDVLRLVGALMAAGLIEPGAPPPGSP